MQEVSKESSNLNSTAIVLLNTRMLRSYSSVKEMVKPDAKSPWGNHFAFLHVPIPKFTDSGLSDPLEFIKKAQQIIKSKRSSLGVYLTAKLLKAVDKFRGPEVYLRFSQVEERKLLYFVFLLKEGKIVEDAPVLKMWYLVTLLSLSSLVNGGGVPQVPCYFIFGSSLYDNGNNNAFVTAARANYPPYGIDFRRGPTGRFTNGRNTADIIAELLGFDNYIPPFASARGQDILKGVNYASGSSGIRDETGQHLGARISMNQQLLNHQSTISRIVSILGDNESASKLLSKCIYTVGIGNNDYIGNYFSRFYPTRSIYTIERYAEILIQQYSGQLKVSLLSSFDLK
ncbi:hypothetical protein LWI29_005917 [Acer saccharum]|uniref:O-acyltransferase WSD1 C-terminal domain-containing protein n=1 Tax=Acer saccharum TaxID=4024 RepID=A0AA39VV11_ACESA|nr:hypothetical protein LWI29_005917 [Acer saccharum]